MIWFWISLATLLIFASFWFIVLERKIVFKRKKIKARRLLSNLVLIFILFDAFCTIVGQPAKYWSDYSRYWEGNPLAQILLKFHPLAFVLGILLWAVFSNCLIRFVPWRLSQLYFLALFLGHSSAIFSWLPTTSHNFFYLICFFHILIAAILLFLIEKVFSRHDT